MWEVKISPLSCPFRMLKECTNLENGYGMCKEKYCPIKVDSK